MKTQRLFLSPENQPNAFPRFKNLSWQARPAQLKNLGFSCCAMLHALCDFLIFQVIRQLMARPDPPRKKIGFLVKESYGVYNELT
jgi:hypothetical protein